MSTDTPFLFHPQSGDWVSWNNDWLCLSLLMEPLSHTKQLWVRSEPNNEEELHQMEHVGSIGRLEHWRCWLPMDTAVWPFHYCFKILAEGRQWWLDAEGIGAYLPLFERQFRIHIDDSCRPPQWVADQVFYQIFPDRFCNGDPALSVRTDEYSYRGGDSRVYARDWDEPFNPSPRHEAQSEFYGGDLPGIESRLDYLQQLGVTALYLNPIFCSPSNHKYDTTDYYQVDPHLGGNQAFSSLTGELHRRGMKIVLDAVLNHTSSEHPWFGRYRHDGQGAFNNRHSPYRQWYLFDEHNNYYSWKGHDSLPKLDFGNEQVRAMAYAASDSVIRHWLKAPYQIDGWRFDVIHMLGEGRGARNNAKYVRAFRQAMREENPASYMLGEHFSEGSRWLQGEQEDGCMNYYGFAQPVWAFLGGKDIKQQPIRLDANELARWLTQTRARLPFVNQLAQLNLLDSHDTPRILTILDNHAGRLHLALTLQMTYPGTPCIYYGDEIGMTGNADPGCRAPFRWDPAHWNHGIHRWYQQLTGLRQRHAALRRGDVLLLHAEGDALVYARSLDGDHWVVAINRGDEVELELPLWQLGVESGKLSNPIDQSRRLIENGQAQLGLPAGSCSLWHIDH